MQIISAGTEHVNILPLILRPQINSALHTEKWKPESKVPPGGASGQHSGCSVLISRRMAGQPPVKSILWRISAVNLGRYMGRYTAPDTQAAELAELTPYPMEIYPMIIMFTQQNGRLN